MAIATLWILAAALLMVAETLTGEFTLASIALACLAAGGVAGLGGSFALQAGVAAVSAVVAAMVLAPLMRRRLAPPTTADPIQAMVGLEAEVVEALGPGRLGKVKVNGVVWQAEADAPAQVGTRTTVMEVLGARLRVMPHDQPEDPPARAAEAPETAHEAPRPMPQELSEPPSSPP